MSEINPFTPNESEEGHGESNVFLDLNKPDEATGVPATMPGMGDGASSGAGGGFSAGSSEPSKFNGQVLLAGMVFVVGVGAIYAMRYIGMQAGIKESVKMVEYTASTTSPDFVQRFDEVMADLEEVSYSVRFDQNTELPTSPFTMAVAEEPTIDLPVVNTDDSSARMARLAQQREQQLREAQQQKINEYERAAMGLNLQSILGGSRPVARISGEPVRVGMKVADIFTVESIKGSTVILSVEDLRYEITLGSGAVRID